MEVDGTPGSTGGSSDNTNATQAKLTKEQILWFVNILDINGDGRVDYR